MSGVAPDPLDRILTCASGANSELYADVLALVEVARAARAAVEHDPDETDGRQHLYDLAAALARLEGTRETPPA